MSVKIQWTEAGEPENWETFIEVETDAEALERLVEHVNDRDAIADFFRVERN